MDRGGRAGPGTVRHDRDRIERGSVMIVAKGQEFFTVPTRWKAPGIGELLESTASFP